ncbi:hypothetical protein GCM10008959_36910 [Deinococcus seoulensis]|uniref:Uncharacterized protein n=1 Tax=Deinococcus seoulensis TaxID=1837379 RepID=A0ABQ2RWD1_9DEIO|nr:hypothetical protein [Deinococcus seoulensis]GGR71939.1 hypothetical protein GCM10008959_36910 [Deinococcus seoulensis]
MKHSAIIWKTDSDITEIIQRKGLNYPDESPEIEIRLSERDFVMNGDSYHPADFHLLAETLSPPFYGEVELETIWGEDCLPTSLLLPLFNLKALEVLRQQAPGLFHEYPVFVMELPIGFRLPSARAMMAHPDVRVAPDGYALIYPLQHLDRTQAHARLTGDVITVESEQEIPAVFRSGSNLYVRDEVKRACEEAGLSGFEFTTELSFSEFWKRTGLARWEQP